MTTPEAVARPFLLGLDGPDVRVSPRVAVQIAPVLVEWVRRRYDAGEALDPLTGAMVGRGLPNWLRPGSKIAHSALSGGPRPENPDWDEDDEGQDLEDMDDDEEDL